MLLTDLPADLLRIIGSLSYHRPMSERTFTVELVVANPNPDQVSVRILPVGGIGTLARVNRAIWLGLRG